MIYLAKSQIAAAFEGMKNLVLRRSEISQIIAQSLAKWIVENPPKSDMAIIAAKSQSQLDVIHSILANTQLEEIELPFPYRKESRFTWGEAPTLQIVQSLEEKGYFTHFTAMQMHGLTSQIPKIVYFNVEQTATGGGGILTQSGIDRAFKNRCRVSRNIINFRSMRICKLNGQNTGKLGVIELEMDGAYSIRLANVERTLIDAAVRPVYSGGVGEVAKAYEEAADKISLNLLVQYLSHLNYTYPYHQSIGYYMERSGKYSHNQTAKLRKFPIEFDFYLSYQLKNPEYIPRWRLFVPKGF